jgi:hypothetical protein
VTVTPSQPEYREIPLTQGQVAIVDASDYDDLMRFRWFAHLDRTRGCYYAGRNVPTDALRPSGKARQKYQSMHRYLLGNPIRKKVDHRDRKGLHNWRGNLRVATNAQNGANSGIQINNTTGYRGVTYRKERAHKPNPWFAYIYDKSGVGKQINLGFHATAEDAARAHDRKSLELRGEFASLNFPLEVAV